MSGSAIQSFAFRFRACVLSEIEILEKNKVFTVTDGYSKVAFDVR